MKSYLIALCCLISSGLFSQSSGITLQIDLINAPVESVSGNFAIVGQNNVDDYPIQINNGTFTNVYPEPELGWNYAVVIIDDCNGEGLVTVLYQSDSTSFYNVVFNYCESDSVFGCTDPEALNYQPEATIDDGSCAYEGAENDLCANAIPLDTGYTLIDNTFTPVNEGIIGDCWNFGSGEGEQSSLWFTFTTPPTPAEISIEAISDGSNTLNDTQFGLFSECGGDMLFCDGNSGEGLLSAFDFSCGELDTNATYILIVDGWNGDVGTCFLNFEISAPCGIEVFGCTDPDATNYNPDATVDDGSCAYEECENNLIYVLINTQNWASEISWNIRNENGVEVAGSGGYSDYSATTEVECLQDGCYEFELFDSFGDGWNGGAFQIVLNDTIIAFGTLENGSFGSVTFGVNASGCVDLITYGCTDPEAINYNPAADQDDGSCEYECSENEMQLYISTIAGQDSAGYLTYSINQDGSSSVINGSTGLNGYAYTVDVCIPDGCFDLTLSQWGDADWIGSYIIGTFQGDTLFSFGPDNYQDSYTISFGINASCEEILGCTDPSAINFNPDATIDNGTCEYEECENNQVSVVINTQNWGYEISWNISNEAGEEVAGSGDYANYSTITELTCLEDGCYTFELFDSFGDGWNGATFEILLNDTALASGTLNQGDYDSVSFGVNAEGCGEQEVFGCMDPEAINFNPEATIDDGSCSYDFECGISFDVIADSTGENTFHIIPSTNIADASNVLWDFGDGATSTELYPTHIYEDDGPYLLCLYVSFGDSLGNLCEISYCQSLDGSTFGGSGILSSGFTVNVIPTATLSDNLSIADTKISVYPNPTNDIATLSYYSHQTDQLILVVTDLTGKILQQRILTSSIGEQNVQIDFSDLPQGLYLIGLEQNGSRSYAKVVRR